MTIISKLAGSDIFILILLAIIIGITGLVILIIGIRKNKIRIWLTSVFILALSLIIGSTGIFLGIRKLITNPESAENLKYFHFRYNDKNSDKKQEGFEDKVPFKKYTVEGEAVMVNDKGSSEKIKIFAFDRFEKKGLFMESPVTIMNNPGLKENFVYLNVRFNSAYRGYLYLKTFTEERAGLEKSFVEVDIHDSITLQLAFRLVKEIDFSDISYCTISTLKE